MGAVVLIVRVTSSLLLTAPNEHWLAVGSPEQANVTLEALRLPSGLIVMVVVPLCPGADTVTVVGFGMIEKSCTSSVCGDDVDRAVYDRNAPSALWRNGAS